MYALISALIRLKIHETSFWRYARYGERFGGGGLLLYVSQYRRIELSRLFAYQVVKHTPLFERHRRPEGRFVL